MWFWFGIPGLLIEVVGTTVVASKLSMKAMEMTFRFVPLFSQ
jgi:hypothetical protein